MKKIFKSYYKYNRSSRREQKIPDFNPSCNECSFVIKQNSLGNTDFENLMSFTRMFYLKQLK